MGQKTHPLGFRLGITEFDRSVWFSPQYPRHGALQLSKYAQEVLEDHYIRKTLFKKFPNANIADIEIHRKRVNQRWNSITLLLRAEIVEQFVGLNSKDVLKEVRKALKEELTSFRTHSLCLSTDFEENYFLNSTSKNVSSSKILSTINIKSSSPCLRTTLKPKKEDLREQKTAQIELKGLPQRYRHNASSNSFTPLTDRITFVVVKVTQHWAKAYSIARFLATRLERRERVRCNVMDVLRRMRREDKANRKKVNKSLPLKRFEQDRANTSLSLSKLSLSKQSSQSKQSVFQKHGIPVVRQRLLFFKEVLHRLEKRFQKTLVSNIVLINQEQPIRPERQRVKGIKIQLSGRLNGVEIARTVWSRIGRVPLQTLRAGVDYTYLTAKTIYGLIGIKVWVFRTPLTTSNQWEHLSVPQVWSLSTNAPIWSDIVSRFVPKSQKNWQVIIKQLFTKTELEHWDKEWNKAQNKTNQKNKRPGRRF